MAVLTMASEHPGPTKKKLHPFFTAPRHTPQSSNDENRPPPPPKSGDDDVGTNDVVPQQDVWKRGITPALVDQAEKDDQEPPKKKRGRPPKKPSGATDMSEAGPSAQPDEPVLTQKPRSTRASGTGKTNIKESLSPENLDSGKRQDTIATDSGAGRNSITAKMEINIRDESAAATKPPTPPQQAARMLKINPLTGTFGPPPSPKPTRAAQNESLEPTPLSPRRKLKSDRGRSVVTIRYGLDDDTRVRIGARIEAILNGPGSPKPASPKSRAMAAGRSPAPKAGKKTDNVPRVPHPFFSKLAQKSSTASPVADAPPMPKPPTSTTKQFTSTPVSPKRRKAPISTVGIPQFGIKSTGLRVPGAQHPTWPWKDTTHVRGDESHTCARADPTPRPLGLSRRKMKGRETVVAQGESVLATQAGRLNIGATVAELELVDFDSFEPPPQEVRLPQKYFESGRKLQARIESQLSNQCPALKPLFDSIGTSLSAFDRAECESHSWTHKYAPAKASEIIQSGREPFILKDWLNALKVESVDKGPGDNATLAASKPKGSGDISRKKRKKTKLDGFIVSSDDDCDGNYADSEDERDWAPSGRHGVLKPTVVRAKGSSLNKDGRLANGIVLSGPYGCGKTAAVFAAAKELDFEVFEINPTVKRNGKDITEKIGDMTRNHLVQQKQSTTLASGPESLADEHELSSGKQSTMASFFQKKPSQQNKSKRGPKQSQRPTAQASPPTKQAKSQKQSLLLLEEVDLLYEEDKTFWSAVIALMAQSKRPFIMTCNDETLVPLHTLDLHAILRFAPPPADIAVDRLIMIAANEGHALERQAVRSLFESRGHDLRATLTDLQFWCQIGIGDRRGGVDWFYMRYPKGVDIDEEGRVVRVVSSGTYQEGMGWLGRDSLFDGPRNGEAEEEAVLQTWDNWGYDISDWQDSATEQAYLDGMLEDVPDRSGRLGALAAYSDFADSLSIADMASSLAFAPGNRHLLDATLPELSTKARDDYVIGLQLLEAPILENNDSMRFTIPTSIKLMAKKELLAYKTRSSLTPQHANLAPLTEASAIECICKRNSEQSQADRPVGRIDFAFAFDPIASVDPFPASGSLEASVFDRNFEPIVLDVAPYVRCIVAYDAILQQQRLKLSNLISEGGRGPKRIRTTRAALSALEGGQRSTTRKEKWFKADLNGAFVKRTAGKGWEDAAAEAMSMLREQSAKVEKVERQDVDDDADELG